MELYDLSVDASEKNNVAAAHPETVKAIETVLQKATVADAPYFPYKK